jgi:hypothetical protein
MATLCGLAGSDAEKAVIHRNITSDRNLCTAGIDSQGATDSNGSIAVHGQLRTPIP